MRRFVSSLLLTLLTVSLAFASGSEQTHNTLPQSNSAFLTTLQNFLKEEDAKRFGDMFQSFVSSGCLHGTGAGLTGTPSTCTAYPGGYYTLETASITYADNSTSWVVVNKDITGNLGTFVRVGSTNYLVDATSVSQPTLCTNCSWMMKVTTSGGAITAVTDLRVLTPLGDPTTFGSCVRFQGSTVDTNYTSLCVTDPTANRTVTLADMTGTLWPLSGLSGFGTANNILTTAGSGAPSWLPGPTARGSIAGFQLANSPTDLNNDVTINPGTARDLAFTDAWAVDTGSTLSTSLIAYWNLDEGGGCRRDTKNYYDWCAPNAVPTSAVAGATNRGIGSADFTASSSQYETVPATPTNLQLGNVSVSISAWVYIRDKTANRDILSQFGNSNATDQFKLEYNTGSDRFTFIWYTDGSGTNATATASNFGSPTANTWYHIVVYHDATNNLIGICVNNGTCNTTAANGGNSTTQSWCLGCSVPGASVTTLWDGRIDEVAVWRKVLATQEKTDLYNSGNGQQVTRTYSDSTTMTLTSQLVKQTGTAWAVGTKAGCLDVGSSRTASSWYHFFVIRRSDTSVTDILCSLDPINPTLPTSYSVSRRVGSVYNGSGGNLTAFYQIGDYFFFAALPLDVNASNGGTAGVLRTLTVPTGVRTRAVLQATYVSGTAASRLWLSAPDMTDAAPSPQAAPLASLDVPMTVDQASGHMEVMASSSAQIRSRESASGTNNTLYIATRGYLDFRGKDGSGR